MTTETQNALPSAATQIAAAAKPAKSKPAGNAARKAAKRPGKVTVTKPATKPATKAKPAAKAKAKPAAKAKKPAKAKTVAGERLVPANLEVYVKDTEHKTAGGNASIHCGDDVAKKLLGKDIDECYKIAAKTINEPEKALRAKYAHLNVGMQRMNLGNRMRGAAA